MAGTNYLRLNCVLLKYSGLVSVDPRTPAQIWMVRIWRTLQCLIFMYIPIAAAIGFWEKVEFEMLVQRIVYTGMGVCFLVKVIYCILFENACVSLIKEMRSLFKSETRTEMEEKSMRGRIALVDKITAMFFIFFSIAAQIAIIMPLLFNKTSQRIFPMPLWFPKICKTSPFYEFILFLHCFAIQMFVNMTIGIDVFFLCAVLLICGQFDLLGWECKCLLYKASKLEKQNENLELRSKQNREGLLREFCDLIGFHQSLLSFCDRFNKFFSPIYLLYIFIVLCVMVFLCFITIETNKYEYKILFGVYLLFAVTFFFLPCFLGQLLSSQSEIFFEELYDSVWYECDESFKKIFKLLHFKARAPIFLTMGKFGNLSLNVFLVMMRSVVSYVTVLRQLSE